MTKPAHFLPDFHLLSTSAAACAAQWRAWAEHHAADTDARRRAIELAALFDQQSRILHNMHNNRVTPHPITRANLKKPTP
jgi:hypothetical protein